MARGDGCECAATPRTRCRPASSTLRRRASGGRRRGSAPRATCAACRTTSPGSIPGTPPGARSPPTAGPGPLALPPPTRARAAGRSPQSRSPTRSSPGRPIRSPPPMNVSTATIQNGLVAMMTAASPLGTNCSAHTTPPLPIPSINRPSTANRGHSAGPGSRSPRASSAPMSTEPAMQVPDAPDEHRRDAVERDLDGEVRGSPDDADGRPRDVGSAWRPAGRHARSV